MRADTVVREFNFSLPQVEEEDSLQRPSRQPNDVVVAVDESPVRIPRPDHV
jgi:hypothetical protein